MKRILSILAVITGAVYLISGISVLAFQDVVKVAMGYGAEYEADLLRVYPIQNILELAVMGFPVWFWAFCPCRNQRSAAWE